MSTDDPGGPRQSDLVFERERADAALRESEQRYRSLFDRSFDCVYVHDFDGKFLDVNPAALNLFGYTREELLSLDFFSLLGDDQSVEAARALSELKRTGVQQSCTERRLRCKNGDYVDVETRASVIFRDGSSYAVQGIARDVTDRRLAEQELRAGETRDWAAFEANPNPMWVMDVETLRFLSVNDAAVANYGYTRDEFRSMTIADIRPTEDLPRLQQVLSAIEDHDGVDRFEARHLTRDGTLIDVEITSHSFDAGRHRSRLVMVQDVTERKRFEADLVRGEARFRGYFELPLLGMAVSSPETGWIEVNDQVRSMMGYSRDEMLRMTWVELTHPDDLAADLELFGRLLAGQIDQYAMEKRYVRKNGEIIWGNINVGCVRRPDGAVDHVVAFIQDITAHKRAEQEKIALEAQLRQAQKMESVGRLAGGVAHDFNNMLGVILGHVELALEEADPVGLLHEDLIEIKQAARRSADLTGQLLAFARRQTVVPRVLDLNETIGGMLKMLERLIGENVVLSFLPGSDLWPLRVDPSQIDQIVANLCVNARDAIAGVGHLTIETKNCRLDDTFCAGHLGSLPGDYVCFTVSDDGRGMDQETLSHLFEPFFTTKGVGEGTGLGLATVYGIVKQNRGFIDVDSESDRGTTFTIYLPRHEGKVAPAEPEMPGLLPARGHETILVVEDEPTILKMTERMLAGQGYTVLTAATPGEALRVAQEHRGDIQLLMTDVIMPEMNGRDLAKSLLSLYPQVRRLFMSGYTADIIAHHGVLDEGVHFLQKPFSMQDLAAKVREALDGE